MPDNHPMQPVIEKYAGLPFQWGRSDCCTFVGECIEAMGQKNPMHKLRYTDGVGAAQVLSRAGGLAGAISYWLRTDKMPSEPADGDVALIPDNNGHYAAAIVFRGRLVAKTQTGLMDYPLEHATRFWRCRR